MAISEEERLKRKEERRIKKWNETYQFVNGEYYKKCAECNKYLLATTDNYYHNKSNGLDGLNTYCIICTIIRNTNWASNNQDKVKEYDRRKIESKNPMRIARSKAAAEKNRKEGYQKRWRQSNPDKVKINNEKYSHKKHDITLREWDACRLYFNYRCAYCGLKYEEHIIKNKQDLHQEHVDHNGANNLSNCVPSCRSCNSSKKEKSFEDWYNSKNKKFSEERKNKIIKWLHSDCQQYKE